MRKRWPSVVVAVFVAAMGLLFCHTWSLDAGPPPIVAAAPLDAIVRADSSPLPPHNVTAGRWVTECVDCPVNTGVISLTGQFQSLSLAVDSQDYMHVAYYRENEGRGHLGYLYLDAEGWHVEIVDTTMAGYPYPGIALALDANDAPHISYYSYN